VGRSLVPPTHPHRLPHEQALRETVRTRRRIDPPLVGWATLAVFGRPAAVIDASQGAAVEQGFGAWWRRVVHG
jgi:hypothetical protein